MKEKLKLREKIILPNTWRYLGLRCPEITPSSVPIAGKSITAIQNELGGEIDSIGRFQTKNAFLIVKDSIRFLYVRPDYNGYRTVANRVFPAVPWKVDYDHALAKNIALRAIPRFNYVLIIRVPPSVNRQHGYFEKNDQLDGRSPDVCFADDRILDKWLSRPPRSRNRSERIMDGYSYDNKTTFGLTLKQRGKWAYAIGIEIDDKA